MDDGLTPARVVSRHELANWLVRFALPEVLDATGHPGDAAQLRALPVLTADRVGSRRPFPGALAVLQRIEKVVGREHVDRRNAAVRAGWDRDTEKLGGDAERYMFEAASAARAALLPSQLGAVAYRIMHDGLAALEAACFEEQVTDRAAEYRALLDRLEVGLVKHSVYEARPGGITLLPADITDDEITRMVRHEYAGTGFTDPEIDVLDFIAQVWHRLGDDLGEIREPADEALSLALSRGWIVRTSFGLEPSYTGLQTADVMRSRVGYSPLLTSWEERLQGVEEDHFCTVPEPDRQTFLVLSRLDRFAAAGWANQAVPHGDDLVFLVSHPEHCEAMPSFVIPAAAVTDCAAAGLVAAASGSWMLTPAGSQWLKNMYAVGSWEMGWADEDQPAEESVGAAR